jgi:hypothetical protein
VGANSKKFGVFTKIVLDNLSKFPLTSLDMPPNKNLTDNFWNPLNAVPKIDRIVLPVAGPQLGETDKILKGPKATTLVSLQYI